MWSEKTISSYQFGIVSSGTTAPTRPTYNVWSLKRESYSSSTHPSSAGSFQTSQANLNTNPINAPTKNAVIDNSLLSELSKGSDGSLPISGTSEDEPPQKSNNEKQNDSSNGSTDKPKHNNSLLSELSKGSDGSLPNGKTNDTTK